MRGGRLHSLRIVMPLMMDLRCLMSPKIRLQWVGFWRYFVSDRSHFGSFGTDSFAIVRDASNNTPIGAIHVECALGRFFISEIKKCISRLLVRKHRDSVMLQHTINQATRRPEYSSKILFVDDEVGLQDIDEVMMQPLSTFPFGGEYLPKMSGN